jgi:hypothetical protein
MEIPTIGRKFFINNSESLNDYQECNVLFDTFEEHLEAIQKCIARTVGGFIIKMKTDNDVEYKQIKRSNANDYLGFTITYMEKRKSKVTTCLKFVKEIESELVYFDGMRIMGSNKRFLNTYRPPCGKYIEGLPERIIEFFEKRIENKGALHECLSSHAYRFRYPSTFIEKCFIHYSPTGNTGKSLLAAILGLMYPNFANVAAQQQQLEGKFTGWAQDLLMIHVEELQNSNYRNHDFERIIKQMTTRNSSGEKKFQDTKAGENSAIVGVNTNKPDLYGLIRGDEALISRLVIIMFRAIEVGFDWDEFKREIGLCSKTNTEQDRFNLGYSMYIYLKTRYNLKSKFNPTRYYDQEKFDIIEKLKKMNKNSIESWLNELRYEDDGGDEYSIPREYQILVRKTIRKVPYTCIKKTQRDIRSSYNHFMKEFSKDSSAPAFKIDTVIDTLIRKGFEEVKSSGILWLRIETEKFKKLLDTTKESVKEVEFDSDEEEKPKEDVKARVVNDPKMDKVIEEDSE